MDTPNLAAEITLKWGDGNYTFALKGKQIELYEKLCGLGIQEIAERLFQRRASYIQVRKAIELGLEGGGTPPVVVQELMGRFFDGQPLANPIDPSSPLATAQAIVSAVFFGFEDLETTKPGEVPAGESPANSALSGFRSEQSG